MNVLIWNSWVTAAGGMERIALSLANGLSRLSDVNVTLVGPYDQIPMLRKRVDPKVNFVACEFKRRPLYLFRNAMLLQRLVRELAIDVVSAHGSLLPLLCLDIPVLWTEHGPRYGDQPVFKGLRRASWSLVKRKLHKRNWKLIGCSQYVCDRLCPQFGLSPKQASVIFNGIHDSERFTSLRPPSFDSPYKIGFLGRIEPEKHPDDIFILDQFLEHRGVPCEWHVFGDGSMARELEVRAAGHPRIYMRGLAAEPATAFAEIDAFVFLSHGQTEGLPTVMIESQMARRPTIAWDVTANPEVAGPADELVKPFDLELFADAVARVCKKGQAAPITERFKFDTMTEKYYCELLAYSKLKETQPETEIRKI